jgi:hypothetical protein
LNKNIKTPFARISWEGRFPPLWTVVFFILANIVLGAIVLAIVTFLVFQVLAIATTGWAFWPVFWLVLALVIMLSDVSK